MMVGWQYGLLPPLDWGDDCEAEMAGQVELWNRLIAIERQRRAAIRAVIVSDDPALSDLHNEFDRVVAQCDALPRRPPPDSEPQNWRAAASQLREHRRELWAVLKPRLAAARRHHADAIKEINNQRYQAITIARNQSGLWWGNYNAVCAAFDVALGRLAPGDQLRDQQWRGVGRLTNQIMNGVPAPALSIGGGHAQLRIEEMPAGHPLLRRGHGKAGRLKLLSATVYSHGRGTRRMASWPIVMHRGFPPGAVVKTLVIHRRRIGAPLDPLPGRRGNRYDWQWTASFTYEIPDVAVSTANQACGIDIGWRKVTDGVRIATIAGSDEEVAHVILPQAWLDRRLQFTELQGRARVLADGATTAEDTIRWHRDRHSFSHGLHEINAERREIYRIAAKRITERYGLIAVDGTNVARLARRGGAAPGYGELPPEARRMRTWSAPAELMAEIERAARSRGCRVLIAQGKTTVVCHRCGHENNPPHNWRPDLVWRCANCRSLWDQDENAARNCLSAALAESGTGTITVAPRENKGLRQSRMTRKATARKLPANPLNSGPKNDPR